MFARNKTQRKRNSSKVIRRRVLLEAWVEPKLRRAMRKVGAESALEYSRGGLGRVDAIAIPDYQKDVRDILNSLYKKTAESMAGLLKDSAKATFENIETKDIDETLERLLEKFEAQALKQAKTISETMKDEVRMAITPLVQEGAGEREIGRAIRKRVDSLAPWQANRIARTETLMVSSQAQAEIISEMDDMPRMAKEWDSSRDSRTRKWHRGVMPVLDGEKFRVGPDQMEYPGDRSGKPANIISCRCVCNWVPAEDMAELEAEVEDRLADIREDEEFEGITPSNDKPQGRAPSAVKPKPVVKPEPERLKLEDVTKRVELDGFKKEPREKLLSGVTDVFTRYGMTEKLERVGKKRKRDRSMGVYWNGRHEIDFQNTFANDKKKRDAIIKKGIDSREERVARYTRYSNPDKYPNDYHRFVEPLKKLKETKRWGVYEDSENPVSAVAWHEAGHAVYFSKKLDYKWNAALDRNHAFEDAHRVSEYGASSKVELFAEVVAAIEDGRPEIIPNSIMKAFRETVE